MVEYVPPGDLLVVNATRVFRARLLGTRETGGGAPAEVLILRQVGDNRFEALVHPGGKLRPGRRVRVSDDLTVIIDEMTERRTRLVSLESSLPAWDALQRFGHVPLPPYIHRDDVSGDEFSYQTVFAREVGSAAAPTAGLHFSPTIVAALGNRGVRFTEVVLHVGAGTFRPVRHEDPDLHEMHEERYSIDAQAARTIEDAKAQGGRVWAVGTTVLRALESNWLAHGRVTSDSAETRLFVRPPFDFKVVDRLLTNFHLPRSTLLMLVAAFAGYDLTMRAYREAIDSQYRFYSYGDAMLVV